MKTNAINLFNFIIFIYFSFIFIKNWFIYKRLFSNESYYINPSTKRIYKSLHYLNFYL